MNWQINACIISADSQHDTPHLNRLYLLRLRLIYTYTLIININFNMTGMKQLEYNCFVKEFDSCSNQENAKENIN